MLSLDYESGAGGGAVVFGDGTILLSNSPDSVVSSVTSTGTHTVRRKMCLYQTEGSLSERKAVRKG